MTFNFLHQDFSGNPDMETLTFISSLKPDKSINAFFEGYKNNKNKWNADIALQKFNHS